jgi:hypothetical protein
MEDREDRVEVEPRHHRLALARGPPIDREDRLLARAGHQVHLASAAAGPRRLEARLFDHLRRRHRRRWPIRERPPAVFFDPDRHRLVPFAVKVREHRSRRRQRHFVLPGPAAVQDADAKTLHVKRIIYP